LKGESNHERFCGDALTIEPAVTTGLLYHLPYGFPAMFDTLAGQVFGEVMTFTDIKRTLERLDMLEGYRPNGDSHYIRISKPVTILKEGRTTTAWVYVYPESRLEEIRRVGVAVPDGQWSNFVSRRDVVTA
jgi:gamma-glutamylcyclotransferase (GGCT)/AIG2-like uncharacterized protein YtfP